MVVDLFRWPLKARQFQEVIAAAVESFSREGVAMTTPEAPVTAERTHPRALFARADGSTRHGKQ